VCSLHRPPTKRTRRDVVLTSNLHLGGAHVFQIDASTAKQSRNWALYANDVVCSPCGVSVWAIWSSCLVRNKFFLPFGTRPVTVSAPVAITHPRRTSLHLQHPAKGSSSAVGQCGRPGASAAGRQARAPPRAMPPGERARAPPQASAVGRASSSSAVAGRRGGWTPMEE
jgi:hypothetical protein